MTSFWFTLFTAVRFTAIFVLRVGVYNLHEWPVSGRYANFV